MPRIMNDCHIPVRRRRVRGFWSLAGSLLVTRPLWAQAPAEETKADWVVAYALVGLCIGLALYSICRPAARRKRS